MRRKHIFYLGILFLSCFPSFRGFSQQEATFSQFMFAHQLLNPAYVGSKMYTNATALHRAQWLGFEGAPVTQALAVNGRVQDKQLGWGVHVLNDKIGPIVNTVFNIDGAYHLTLNEKGHQLALGVKMGIHNYNLNADLIRTLTPGDVAFDIGTNFDILPNIGFGLYYHQPKFYMGFSIPRMLSNNRYQISRHGYLVMGGMLSITPAWTIKPNILFKQSEGSPMGFDFSALLIYEDRFWLGPQVRSAVESLFPNDRLGGAYGMMGGIHLNANWSVGYAYSTGLGDLNAAFNAGTHEIILRFDFNIKDLAALRSPRIF